MNIGFKITHWDFFDLLFKIEPAMLLMARSVPKYSAITLNLIEFLVLLIQNFDASHPESTLRGITNSFTALLEKGVVK